MVNFVKSGNHQGENKTSGYLGIVWGIGSLHKGKI